MKIAMLFRLVFFLFILLAFLCPWHAAHGQVQPGEKALKIFIDDYVKKAAPLEKEANLAEWNAFVTGKKEDYKRKADIALKLDLLHSNSSEYHKLMEFSKSGEIKDPLLLRQLTLLINEYGPKQIRPELLKKINDKEAEVQLIFNTYRGKAGDRELSERDIYEILKNSTDRTERRKAWEAQKGVGKKVAPLLVDLVKLRNEAARSLGFENYYAMKIQFNDQDVEELTRIFKNLYEMTEEAFTGQKIEMDAILAKRLSTKPEDLRPWDYPNPFFQDAPGIYTADLDRYFKGKDIPAIVSSFYEGAGLPMGDILKRSDLYEKKGKSQHAFCYDIDRQKDIRILMNLRTDEESCATLLHESGHSVYEKYLAASLPWLLREPSHTFTTEASAMMFERLTKNPGWLRKMTGISQEDAESLSTSLLKDLALQELIFCRWTEVMFNFERELYRDPDQDLNSLWWDMVEKYQKLRRPEGRNEPDWASKIHLASSPVYYHNYMLGELMVSQMMHTIGTKVLSRGKNWSSIDFVKEPSAGKWLRENIYNPGARYRWNELLIHATGESLNPKYFSEQFITRQRTP
jgi:peptidyl-dipeptidase A